MEPKKYFTSIIVSTIITFLGVGQNHSKLIFDYSYDPIKLSSNDYYEILPLKIESFEYEKNPTISRAIKSLRNNELDSARLFLEKASNQYSEHISPHYYLGFVHLKSRQLKKSESSFKQALKKNPLLINAKFMLGIIYLVSGDLSSSSKIMNEIESLPSHTSDAYFGLGLIEIEKELNLDKAVKYFKKSIESDPKNLKSYLFLALIHHSLSQMQKANDILSEGISVSKNWERGLIMRAIINQQYLQNPEKYEEDLMRLIKLNPEEPDYYKRLSELKLYQSDFFAGIEYYKTSFRLDSIRDNPYELTIISIINDYGLNFEEFKIEERKEIERGIAELMILRYPNASEAFESVSSSKNLWLLNYCLAVSYENQGSEFFEKAIENYSKYLSTRKDDYYTYLSRADIYTLNKQYELAINDYDLFIQNFPSLAIGYYKRALLHISKNNRISACKDLRTASDIDKQLTPLLNQFNCLESDSLSNLDRVMMKSYGWEFNQSSYAQYLEKMTSNDSSGALLALESSSAESKNRYKEKLHLRVVELADFLNELEVMLKALDRLNEFFSAKAHYLLERSKLHYQLGNYELAEKDLLRYLEIFPNKPQGLYQLGLVKIKQGNLKKGEKLINKSGLSTE